MKPSGDDAVIASPRRDVAWMVFRATRVLNPCWHRMNNTTGAFTVDSSCFFSVCCASRRSLGVKNRVTLRGLTITMFAALRACRMAA